MVQKENESPGSLSGMDPDLLEDFSHFSETEFILQQSLNGIEVGFHSRLGLENKC